MIVILTALEVECAAVRSHLADVRPHHHPAGTIFEVGRLAARPGCSVALAVIGMGTVNAAAITERAIAEFRPDAVLFVGIAGGLREWIKLGDVVVATRVYAYHGGRVDNGEFLARPRAWDTAHRLVQLAQHVDRSRAWPEAAQTSAAVHFEPIAAGEVVLNSTASPENERLRAHYNDAVAIEMESSGVALASHLAESTPTITIRGVCDFADGTKRAADAGGWQLVAARNAAAFAVGLAAAIDQVTPSAPAPQPVAFTAPAPPAPMQNIRGNYIGSINTTGPVKIKQKIVNYARQHPVLSLLALIAVVALLGAGGYGIVRAVSSAGGNDVDRGNASSVSSAALQAINDHDWPRLATFSCKDLGNPPKIDNDLPVELDNTLHIDDFHKNNESTEIATFNGRATFGPGDYPGGHVERQTLDVSLRVSHVNGQWCFKSIDINQLNLPG